MIEPPKAHKGRPRAGVDTCCEQCGKILYVTQRRVGRTVFCSKSCWYAFKSADFRRTWTDRFWAKVHKTSGCWEWTGALTPNGYGHGPTAVGRSRSAHRTAWELAHGSIPAHLYVCHHCDNKRCVRPDHLYLGTAAENSQDAVDRGLIRKGPQPNVRRRRGSAVHNARFTEDDIREMRRLDGAGVPRKQIAEQFSTRPSEVWRIVTRRAWAHVS